MNTFINPFMNPARDRTPQGCDDSDRNGDPDGFGTMGSPERPGGTGIDFLATGGDTSLLSLPALSQAFPW